MDKKRIEKIAKNIIILSALGLLVADLFLAYFIDSHNQSGLLNFGYTTNLAFLFTFSCPIFYIILVSVNFIKESALYKKGLTSAKKQKTILTAFLLMLVSFLLYTVASSLSSEIALLLLGVTCLTLIVSVTFFFIYVHK